MNTWLHFDRENSIFFSLVRCRKFRILVYLYRRFTATKIIKNSLKEEDTNSCAKKRKNKTLCRSFRFETPYAVAQIRKSFNSVQN